MILGGGGVDAPAKKLYYNQHCSCHLYLYPCRMIWIRHLGTRTCQLVTRLQLLWNAKTVSEHGDCEDFESCSRSNDNKWRWWRLPRVILIMNTYSGVVLQINPALLKAEMHIVRSSLQGLERFNSANPERFCPPATVDDVAKLKNYSNWCSWWWHCLSVLSHANAPSQPYAPRPQLLEKDNVWRSVLCIVVALHWTTHQILLMRTMSLLIMLR